VNDAQTVWIVDAHRDSGQRFIARADEKLTAFLELERVKRESFRFSNAEWIRHNSRHAAFCVSPWEGQEIDCKMQSIYS
jgi:hypothetical protein